MNVRPYYGNLASLDRGIIISLTVRNDRLPTIGGTITDDGGSLDAVGGPGPADLATRVSAG